MACHRLRFEFVYVAQSASGFRDLSGSSTQSHRRR
jgi:hypothetical protein